MHPQAYGQFAYETSKFSIMFIDLCSRTKMHYSRIQKCAKTDLGGRNK
jgi:hypothetical protein